ncbi:GIY-YIG nuclease family protein [Burkholderia sp. 22PA0099]|uniref:GIY-YIG nuclease family protein n=1 Tax=Burkholderia sp. 22PA0099 TaxID=3237372 RepID=UPI0039C2BDE3
MSWFLYLIECEDGSIYTGITTDVDARFAQHANGKGARYTRARKPLRVLASFARADRSSASSAEYWVKRLAPAQKRALASGQRTLESVLPVVEAQPHAQARPDTVAADATATAAIGIAPTSGTPFTGTVLDIVTAADDLSPGMAQGRAARPRPSRSKAA